MKRWWSYTHEDGWLSCAEPQALELQRMLDNDTRGTLEGCKLVCLDVDLDVAWMSKMLRPQLICGPGVDAVALQACLSPVLVTMNFLPLRVTSSQYVPEGTVYMMDAGAFDLPVPMRSQ